MKFLLILFILSSMACRPHEPSAELREEEPNEVSTVASSSSSLLSNGAFLLSYIDDAAFSYAPVYLYSLNPGELVYERYADLPISDRRLNVKQQILRVKFVESGAPGSIEKLEIFLDPETGNAPAEPIFVFEKRGEEYVLTVSRHEIRHDRIFRLNKDINATKAWSLAQYRKLHGDFLLRRPASNKYCSIRVDVEMIDATVARILFNESAKKVAEIDPTIPANLIFDGGCEGLYESDDPVLASGRNPIGDLWATVCIPTDNPFEGFPCDANRTRPLSFKRSQDGRGVAVLGKTLEFVGLTFGEQVQ